LPGKGILTGWNSKRKSKLSPVRSLWRKNFNFKNFFACRWTN